MGFISRFFLGPGYEGGYESGEEYVRQGGKNADDNTIYSVYEDVGLESAEQFHEGWRDAEDDQRTFWNWLRGR